jgi:hypothetical protein
VPVPERPGRPGSDPRWIEEGRRRTDTARMPRFSGGMQAGSAPLTLPGTASARRCRCRNSARVVDMVDRSRKCGTLCGLALCRPKPKQQGNSDKCHGDCQVPHRQERSACRDRLCHLVLSRDHSCWSSAL